MMLIRLIILLLLSANLFAGDLVKNWPVGKKVTYDYNIKTYQPKETNNHSTLTVTKKADSLLVINQSIEIKAQSVIINSAEQYIGSDHKFKSSDNEIIIPNTHGQEIGHDTIMVTANDMGNGKIKIVGNRNDIITSYINNENLLTGTGALLYTRNMNFTVGSSATYNFVNFYQVAKEKEFHTIQVKDSVVGIENVTTSLGSFECYKVKNIVPGGFGYTYYSNDENHLMIKSELMHPETGEPMSTVTLVKVSD